MRISFTILSILILTVVGCKKKFSEGNAPSVYINSPVDGGIYEAGDTVPVKMTFTDDSKVQAYITEIKMLAPASNIFTYSNSPYVQTSVLDTFMVIPSAMHGQYEVIIWIQDPYENITNKVIHFTALP